MESYADRLVKSIDEKGNPCIVGLDPRLDQMPDFSISEDKHCSEAVSSSITEYHRTIIDAVRDIVPGLKLQIAFYEQYGLAGMEAFYETVRYAKKNGLIVIVDAKRNDIASTAQAYASAFLGRSSIFGNDEPIIDADCMTVSPYLGRDSIEPFVDACARYGKGIFILAKTSNPGSADLQDLEAGKERKRIYLHVAGMVNAYADKLIGSSGYSSIGAVVGATFPEEAKALRRLMPKSIFLVPGYGAQGGTALSAAACFNKDGYGAVVSASRILTYGFAKDTTKKQFIEGVRSRTEAMAKDIKEAIGAKG